MHLIQFFSMCLKGELWKENSRLVTYNERYELECEIRLHHKHKLEDGPHLGSLQYAWVKLLPRNFDHFLLSMFFLFHFFQTSTHCAHLKGGINCYTSSHKLCFFASFRDWTCSQYLSTDILSKNVYNCVYISVTILKKWYPNTYPQRQILFKCVNKEIIPQMAKKK